MSNVTRTKGAALPVALSESIDRLMARYCSAIDNGEFDVWPTLFTDDAVYRITTRTDFDAGRDSGILYCDNRGMLEDRVTAIRGVNVYEPHVYRHIIGPTELTEIENLDAMSETMPETKCEAKCETSYIVVRTDVDGDMIIFSAGRYVDQLVFEGDVARFKSRVVVADSARFDTLVALPI